MRAMQITELTGPASALSLAELPVPEPSHMLTPGSGVVVEVHAAGVSFPELLQTRGEYQIKPPLPFVPGSEVGGVVRSAPAGAGVAPGDRAFLLVDIAIHPKVQSNGLGTVLVQRLQQEAQNAKLPIKSTVDRFNPGSLKFHRRLGFQVVREDPMNYFMEWHPAPLV